MKHREALSKIFASAARVTVLRLFLLDPRRAYYQRQIELATGLPIRAVQRELERLSAIHLIYRHVDGNRTYYQVDNQFPLFPELRAMVLKTAAPDEFLRGSLAVDERIRQAFLCESESKVLLLADRTKEVPPQLLNLPPPYTVTVMTEEEFMRALGERSELLDPYLVRGVDLLGRRDDMIWRRIEAAGYTVEKGKGVA